MKNPISVYVKVDAGGKLTERHVCRDDKGYPWIRLTKEANEATMWKPEAYKYNEDGTAEQLVECEMVVSTTSFLADGVEDFSVSIRGAGVPDGDSVLITINGEQHYILKDDHIEVTASAPGTFLVKMEDERYYCLNSEVTVYALTSGS